MYGANAAVNRPTACVLFMHNVVLGSFSLQPTQKQCSAFLLDDIQNRADALRGDGDPGACATNMASSSRRTHRWRVAIRVSKSRLSDGLITPMTHKTDKDVYEQPPSCWGRRRLGRCDAPMLVLSTAMQLTSDNTLAPLVCGLSHHSSGRRPYPYDFTTRMVQEAEGELAIRSMMKLCRPCDRFDWGREAQRTADVPV